jgi:hypothetical protein
MKKSGYSRQNKGLALLAALATLAALLIGCGGGGGDSGGTSATATTSTATATTSTSTTSTSTTSTSTTSTSTTSTSTTSTSTTSTSTTSTSTTSGFWPPNQVFYSELSPTTYEVRHMDPSGANDTSLAVLDNNYAALTLNPAVANQVVFAYQTSPTAKLGIYKNSSPSIVGATEIMPPSFDSVGSLQVSSDGSTVYFVADSKVTTGKLLKVNIATGAAQQLDTAEAAHINIAGDLLVYSKLLTNNVTALFVRGVGAADTATRITDTSFNSTFPQWSKDGSRIVFSSDKGTDGSYDLYMVNPDGSGLTRLTNTPQTDELGGSFNDNGSMVSFVVLAADGSLSGIYRVDTSGVDANRLQLKAVLNPGDTTYWTSANGRGYGEFAFVLDRRMKRARHFRRP